MTQDATFAVALMAGVLALLVQGRWRHDAIAFGGLLAAVLLGLVPADAAFEGFGHPATVIIALALLVSAGLARSGAVDLLARRLGDAARPVHLHILVMGAAGALLSAFINNVAALALLMPVDLRLARKAGRAPGLTLMPLSFATILGGMMTEIGTPPNIIISAIRGERLGTPFAFADFAPVGVPVALAGLAFLALLGWRLVPARPAPETDRATEYISELVIGEDSVEATRDRAALAAALEAAGAELLAVLNARGQPRPARRRALAPGDRLLVEADPETLESLRAELGLLAVEPGRLPALEKGRMRLVEAVVPEGAQISGRSTDAVGLAWRQGAALVGLMRGGRRVRAPLRRQVIRPGDLLLLLVPAGREDEVLSWLGVLPLEGAPRPVPRPWEAGAAVAIFAAAVLAAATGLVPLPVALGLVVLAFLATGILVGRSLYEEINWPVVVLIGAMIPLGGILEDTGVLDALADAAAAAASGLPLWITLGILMAATMSISDVLNNTATAVVAGPLAIALAERLGASPDAFLMGVAVASSCAFLTPIGHKNNLLVMGPGGYRFADYWRVGLPLELIVLATGLPMVLWVWS